MQKAQTRRRKRWGGSLLCVAFHVALLIIVPAAAGESPCPLETAKWMRQEAEAWEAIKAGKAVNLEEIGRPGLPLDPNSPEGWNKTDERTISPDFLRTILINKECRRTVPSRGIHIVGARFTAPLNLSGIHLEHPLKFEKCRFEKEVNLTYIASSSEVSIRGCRFLGNCDLGGAQLQAPLQIDSHGDQSGTPPVRTAFDGKFILQDARINGYVYFKDVIFADEAAMGRLQTNTFLQMEGVRSEKTVDLSGAKADYVTILGGSFANAVRMEYLKVDGSIVLAGGASRLEFGEQVILANARIGGNLSIEYSSPRSIDLSGSQIRGELLISHDLEWKKDSGGLILDNAEVGILKFPMPRELEKLERVSFSGCIYKRLNWVEKQGEMPRDICWPWIHQEDLTRLFEKSDKWFAARSSAEHRGYSAQPYEQLAGVLRAEGYPNLANTVLFAKKDAERNASGGLQWVLLTMQRWLIGYGYDYSYVFYSSLILILIGSVVIRWNEAGRAKGSLWSFIYSVDMLLPILQLESENYKASLEGLARYWFYIHKTAGYILASFVIAGITGITR